jgi:hypothetical protein
MPETKAMMCFPGAENVFRSETLALLSVIAALVGALASQCEVVLGVLDSSEAREHARRFMLDQIETLRSHVEIRHPTPPPPSADEVFGARRRQ